MYQNKKNIILIYWGETMDRLPKVYANPINKNFNNVQQSYSERGEHKEALSPKNINKKINEIFASSNHIYKSKVKITYKDYSKEEVIVGKTNLNLLTMDGKLIKITDIYDIEKI